MERYASILGPVDSAFYYVETPETPMNIGALTIYEGKVDFEAFVNLIQARLHLAPRYFQRIMQAPFRLGQPTWVTDPTFYIYNHVKRVVLAEPASEAQLRAKVGELLSRTLDRNKPLWEIYFIEGLEASTAVFFKVHHCMVDGLAAVDLFTMLMELDSRIPVLEDKQEFSAPNLPDPATLTWDSLQRDVLHRFNMLDKLSKDVTRVAFNLFDTNQRLKMLIGVAHLLNSTLSPIRKLPINGANSGKQQMIWGAFSLDEVHDLRRKTGASVNDVMLTVMTAGVERYSRRRHMNEQAFMRILVPFNVRAEEEIGNYGNRISVLPIDVPFGVADPLERLRAATRYSKAMKDSSLSLTMDMILTLPSLLPSLVQPSIWGVAPVAFSILAHTWCTNVAAPPAPVYLLGHQLKQVYGYFPLNPTMGVAGVIVSYNGQITLSLVVDEAIIPDPQTLENDLREAYAELRRAAGLPDAIPPAPAKEEKPAPETVVSTNGVPPEAKPKPVASTPGVDGDKAPTAASAPANGVPSESKPVPVISDSAAQPTVASAEAETPAAQAESDLESETEATSAVEAAPEAVGAVEKPDATMSGAAPQAAKSPNGSVPQPVAHKLFSDEWAKAFREVINHSDEYRRAGANWTAGSLIFTMNAAPMHDFPQAASVYLNLHRGECRDAYAIDSRAASQQGDFIIAGDYAAWMEVLSGRTSPLVMLTTGRLMLRKGSLLKLLPHTRSATELVNCARRVPWS
ncbi:MAG: wax ester/triacylglycerol synthase family O-acyltransferase [Anaerolineae bacterium]|nr:wax ester/triacylglycerol synthase family O-acyltransferase [Anaerolineae bacterium]